MENARTAFWQNTLDWYRKQPFALKIALICAPILVGKVADESLTTVANHLGLTVGSVAAMVLLAVAGAAVSTRPLHRPDELDAFPPIDIGEEIEVHSTFSREQLENIRSELHEEIYGGSAPVGNEITRMYEANPAMGVGLYHVPRGQYVAFGTAWPLTEAAAKKLLKGTMTENQLTAKDVLGASRNSTAKYVLIPAFGATRRHGQSQRKLLGVKLANEMRRKLRLNFLRSEDRRVVLIATGFSKDGRKWCRRNGMDERCRVTLDSGGETYPVFCRELTWQDAQ